MFENLFSTLRDMCIARIQERLCKENNTHDRIMVSFAYILYDIIVNSYNGNFKKIEKENIDSNIEKMLCCNVFIPKLNFIYDCLQCLISHSEEERKKGR